MLGIVQSQSCPRKLEIKGDQLGIWRTASRLVPAPPVFANDFRHHEGKNKCSLLLQHLLESKWIQSQMPIRC